MGGCLSRDELAGRHGHRALGIAGVLFWMALALHVADEAVTGFLDVYNPTVLARWCGSFRPVGVVAPKRGAASPVNTAEREGGPQA